MRGRKIANVDRSCFGKNHALVRIDLVTLPSRAFVSELARLDTAEALVSPAKQLHRGQ